MPLRLGRKAGIDSAAASETTPLIAAKLMMKGSRQSGLGTFNLNSLEQTLGKYINA